MPKGRPKGFDPDVVLERAMKTFWREGYEGASMAILLKDMGISRQSLYDTYGDKRSLFLKTLQLYIDREIGAIIEQLAAPPPVKPHLLKVIAHFRDMAQCEEPRGCYLANSLVAAKEDDEELSELLSKTLNDIQKALQKAIQTAIDLKEISPRDDAEVVSRGLLNALMGLSAGSKAKNAVNTAKDTYSFIVGTLATS